MQLRVFPVMLAGVVLTIAFLVAGLWSRAGTHSSSVARLRASHSLTDVFTTTLCRPPSDEEIEGWDSQPFDADELSNHLSSTAEGLSIRQIRSVYVNLLRREAVDKDCAAVRGWVDRRLDIERVEQQVARLPETQRVAHVRQIFIETFGRDPSGWDDVSLRRWVDSSYTLAEIKSRLIAQRPLVGAYYFTWYQSQQGSWGNNLTVVPPDTPKPAIGWYASSDAAVIDTHIKQMASVGLDFVIVQVVAQSPASWSSAHTFFDRLSLAGLFGRTPHAAVILDGLNKVPAEAKAMWVQKAKAEFADSANYFTFHGRPLILLFSAPLDFAVPGVLLRNVYWTDRYDPGENTFNAGRLNPRDWPFWSPSPQPLVNGVVPVVPGYDDSRLGRPQSMEYPRQSGQMYHDQWRRALALHPELITIYSWNEHFERTAIEPTAAWGDQYLKWTACYIAHAHRGTSGPC